ncbi:peptidase [Micromonospora fluostatini]|uniref:Peptidase n=1 Tax=Micromonospora fluostatini TaxID=1629071 RepID=A0ABY2DGQ5_9ACTN|nr:peptidase [Micromonospora fluostatini]
MYGVPTKGPSIGGGLATTGAAIQSWLLVGIGLVLLGASLWLATYVGRNR